MARLQIDLTDAEMAALDELLERAGLKTKKDLFNNSLTFLSWALSEIGKGKIIASLDEHTQKYRELHMPIFEHVKPYTNGREERRIA